MKRQSGVLMHVSSLWGDYSCGSFGKNAIEFIDIIASMGFSVWQVLPFTVTDEYNSPYKSYSAFAGNPYFIDLDILFEQGLLTREELAASRQQTPYRAEFERLCSERMALLAKAAARLTDFAPVEEYIAQNPHIASFCRFMALREENSRLPWQQWAVTELSDNGLLKLWQFTQYEFDRQWQQIKAYAGKKGISIIGDIPFYVADDSCDVWEAKELFKLDSKGYPSSVAGVPPDYFAADGQLWGNPLYDWDALKEQGYLWWKQRIDRALKLFDGVRLDHFRAIQAYWSVDAGKKTAKNGKWLNGPGMELIDAISREHEDKLIIAEDLGDITDDVRELVDKSGFPGMRVFQFGFLDDGDSLHMPHNYINNCVAYAGTHDNNTLLGWLWESDGATRKRVLDYCGFDKPDWGNACPYLLRSIFASPAALAIFSVQDLLMYGSDTRMNTPGVAQGNWGFRITREQLEGVNSNFFKELNRIYKR